MAKGPLGIPTIRDRVAQMAVKLIIEPIIEADLEPGAYGYRPQRRVQDALKEVHTRLCQGYNEVVDADLSRYFDTIPHRELMQSVARRPVVRDRLNALLRGWSSYFSYGTRLPAYRAVDNYVYGRVRHFLGRRHKVPTQGTRRFSDDTVFGELGVLRLRRVHLGPPPCAMG